MMFRKDISEQDFYSAAIVKNYTVRITYRKTKIVLIVE